VSGTSFVYSEGMAKIENFDLSGSAQLSIAEIFFSQYHLHLVHYFSPFKLKMDEIMGAEMLSRFVCSVDQMPRRRY
jgi:hypothetical protein